MARIVNDVLDYSQLYNHLRNGEQSGTRYAR
jgi:hypothetical protein